MNKYEIIVKDASNPTATDTQCKAAEAIGKKPVVVCCKHTAKVFQELTEKYDINDETLEVFRLGFVDHHLTSISGYQKQNDLVGPHLVRPEKYVDAVFAVADLLDGDLRKFFLNEFRFEFERQNNPTPNYRLVVEKVLPIFDERKTLVTADAKHEEQAKSNPEFTTARQVLVFHYLFNYLKVSNIDRTEKARFIHFLTGKNFDSIYKKLGTPYKENMKAAKKDLRFVRDYFEKLGLREIVKMINNDIDDKI